jgi:thiamine-phosphate pyrophosphorylase
MNRADADTLWRIASGLAREAAKVSRPPAPSRPGLPPLLFFTNPERTPEPWRIAQGLPAGARPCLGRPMRRNVDEPRPRLREVTRERGVLLLIGRDVDLAQDVGADGVHLPEVLIGDAAALRTAHPDWLTTATFHDRTPAPLLTGLDALVISPVFPAGGASAASPPLGLSRLTVLTGTLGLPAYALGGIDAKNAHELEGSGACGVAGIGSIRAAFGPD